MVSFLQSLSALDLLVYSFSCILTVLAMWGALHFFPRAKDNEFPYDGASWLILAIWVGFIGNGFNAFIWQVLGDPLVFYGVITTQQHMFFGDILGDIVGKGLASLSIYLHFYARWKALDPDERHLWSPLLMGYYPDTSKVIYRTCRRMLRRKVSDKS